MKPSKYVPQSNTVHQSLAEKQLSTAMAKVAKSRKRSLPQKAMSEEQKKNLELRRNVLLGKTIATLASSDSKYLTILQDLIAQMSLEDQHCFEEWLQE
jgi:hypothetical protein